MVVKKGTLQILCLVYRLQLLFDIIISIVDKIVSIERFRNDIIYINNS